MAQISTNIHYYSGTLVHVVLTLSVLASRCCPITEVTAALGQCFDKSVTSCSLVQQDFDSSSLTGCFSIGDMSGEELTGLTEIITISTRPLGTFAIDYGQDVVEHNEEEKEIALTFDNRGGARWRSEVKYESGTFSVKIKTPDGDTSGLNLSFYLSSQEGDKSQDEIDYEFLGKDKSIVQTNYYTEGTGNREELHDLGFISSEEFHEYTIHWLPSKIEWLVDGRVVRTSEKKDGEAFPVRPMYLYASMWNAGDIDGGRWAGSYFGSHEPYVGRYRDVRVPVNHSQSD